MYRRRAFTLGLSALLCGLPTSAGAFKTSTPLTDGCHEAISVAAVRQAGWPDNRSPPALSHDERLIARDLPVDVEGAKDDPWMLALTIGVRWNDLHGLDDTDIPDLATLHSDPDGQDEHCLRAPGDDGVEGDRAALSACTGFIMERIDAALVASDPVDLDARADVQVALAYQSHARVSVQRYGLELGKALHALQDSFSHTLRSADGTRVRHVLNFVDWADNGYRESRDGHAHLDGLDLCGGSEPRRRRRELAIRASAELLSALGDASLDHPARRDAAHAVVARWLRYEPGCTLDNDYCDAPELGEPEPGCSTAAVGARKGERPAPELLAFGLCALVWIGRRRTGRWAIALALLLAPLVAAWPGHAEAQAAAAVSRPTPPGANTKPALASPERAPFGVAALTTVSINEAAFAYRLGARYRIERRFEVGLQAEHNPWLAIETVDAQPGSLNLFGSLFFDWFEARNVTLRSSVHLGMSVLLFELVGAPKGSVGPFVGASLLGLTWQFSPGFRLLVEPAEVVLPVVQLQPIPFYYYQYRLSIGVQWNP